MTEHTALSVEMSEESTERLRALARRLSMSEGALASEAIDAYLDLQEWQLQELADAVHEADRDPRRVSHADVTAWLRSWGSPRELPRPE